MVLSYCFSENVIIERFTYFSLVFEAMASSNRLTLWVLNLHQAISSSLKNWFSLIKRQRFLAASSENSSCGILILFKGIDKSVVKWFDLSPAVSWLKSCYVKICLFAVYLTLIRLSTVNLLSFNNSINAPRLSLPI